MGAVQSDLKANTVRASSGGKVISPRDDEFWQTFWARPETAEHIFETITATDLRSMRDDNVAFENLKTLVLRATIQMIKLRNHASSLSEENSRTGTMVLNCVRILTRVLPYVYESDDSRRWEETAFSRVQDAAFYESYTRGASAYMKSDQSLIEQLIDTSLDLLFYTGFTLPWPDANSHDRKQAQASYGLWQSGIACDTTYHPDSWLPFDPRNPQGDNIRETHVKVCLHFLLINLLNRAPWEEGGKDKNEFRLQFSYLHKPKHFQFLADGIFKILRRPLEASANMLSMAQRSVGWTPEMIILQWEALFTNRKYMHYVIDSGRALDLMVLLIFYAKEAHMEGIGRVCIFCLQTLSAHANFGELLNRPFEAHDTLPMSIQVKNFHGRYADYFIMSMLSLVESNSVEASFWLVSLTTIIRNVADNVVGLARATSSKLLQTFSRLAKPSVLLANESNIVPLSILLEAINSLIELHEQNHENEAILYATWRARDRFKGLRQLSLMDEDAIASLSLPSSRRSSTEVSREGDETEKSRGKRPSEYKSSSVEFMSKLASLPLHTPLALIALLGSEQGRTPAEEEESVSPPVAESRASTSEMRVSPDKGMTDLLRPVRELGRVPDLEHHASPVEAFRFQPSIAALYASYYWGLVVSHDAQRLSGTGAGIWVGTEIKLFRIKSGQVQGPSLWSPKGAVDAVGESLVAGVRDLTMRAKKGISGEGDDDADSATAANGR
ncbi:hypothetical protein ANO11243_020530 [Dothideomycetidae sp. 11243]|nr:hypothetical protein ANO11243_020530 [fungal sp. No.11243]